MHMCMRMRRWTRGVYDGGWGDGMWMKCLMLSQLEGRGSERGGNR